MKHFSVFFALIGFLQTVAFAAVTTDVRSPLSMGVFVPCANAGHGETVVLSGDLHTLAKVTTNGNNVYLSVQNQPQGITGTGSVSGDKYQGAGVTREDVNLTSSFPAHVTTVNNFRIIGQGRSNNLLLHENTHFTINANGVTTAVVDNFRADCK